MHANAIDFVTAKKRLDVRGVVFAPRYPGQPEKKKKKKESRGRVGVFGRFCYGVM